MASRRPTKDLRRSVSRIGHEEAPSRHMPRPVINGPFSNADCPRFYEWYNGFYYGLLRRFESGFPVGGGRYAIISMTAMDESARHDWREFEQLKNWLVGTEWEGLELYPAESRLIDPSNRFFLWCVPKDVIAWGLPGRRDVLHPSESSAAQRPFPLLDGRAESQPETEARP